MMGMILLGVFIIFICPIGLGVALSRLVEPMAGVIGGVVLFAVIVGIGYRNMLKQQQKSDHNDKGGRP